MFDEQKEKRSPVLAGRRENVMLKVNHKVQCRVTAGMVLKRSLHL